MSGFRSALLPISVALFGIGLLAIIVIFVLFAGGNTNLPLWLNLASLLAPIGLITGVVGTILRARRS